MILLTKTSPLAALADRETGIRACLARGERAWGDGSVATHGRTGLRVQRGGFVLLEILMAVALFSSVSVAMVQALAQIADTSMVARREALMVGRLDSAITEAAHRTIFEEGVWETERDAFGISVMTKIEEADVRNREGLTLDGIWRLIVEVRWSDGVREEVRVSETFVNEKLSNRAAEAAEPLR